MSISDSRTDFSVKFTLFTLDIEIMLSDSLGNFKVQHFSIYLSALPIRFYWDFYIQFKSNVFSSSVSCSKIQFSAVCNLIRCDYLVYFVNQMLEGRSTFTVLFRFFSSAFLCNSLVAIQISWQTLCYSVSVQSLAFSSVSVQYSFSHNFVGFP